MRDEVQGPDPPPLPPPVIEAANLIVEVWNLEIQVANLDIEVWNHDIRVAQPRHRGLEPRHRGRSTRTSRSRTTTSRSRTRTSRSRTTTSRLVNQEIEVRQPGDRGWSTRRSRLSDVRRRRSYIFDSKEEPFGGCRRWTQFHAGSIASGSLLPASRWRSSRRAGGATIGSSRAKRDAVVFPGRWKATQVQAVIAVDRVHGGTGLDKPVAVKCRGIVVVPRHIRSRCN